MEPGLALQEFLEFVIGQLVNEPELAGVRHDVSGTTHTYTIRVAQGDMGRVIGRNGYTISAIRSLLDAASQKHGIRAKLEIDETE